MTALIVLFVFLFNFKTYKLILYVFNTKDKLGVAPHIIGLSIFLWREMVEVVDSVYFLAGIPYCFVFLFYSLHNAAAVTIFIQRFYLICSIKYPF